MLTVKPEVKFSCSTFNCENVWSWLSSHTEEWKSSPLFCSFALHVIPFSSFTVESMSENQELTYEWGNNVSPVMFGNRFHGRINVKNLTYLDLSVFISWHVKHVRHAVLFTDTQNLKMFKYGWNDWLMIGRKFNYYCEEFFLNAETFHRLHSKHTNVVSLDV